MSDFEQSNSENNKGRCTTTRNKVYERIGNDIDNQIRGKAADEKTLQRITEQGNGKYTMAGSNDRVNGIPYEGNNNEKYPTQDDKKSYYYGYITHGSRRIEAIIYNLEKEGKYDEIEALGYRDACLGLTEEQIGLVEGKKPNGLANYASYMEGYKAATKSNTRGK